MTSTDYISSVSSSSMSNINNNIMDDDKLINLIKEKFSDSDMELFKFNYEIYKVFKNNKNDFIVDFDEVYDYIGFSSKHKAKELLLKNFIKDKDFMMFNEDKILLTRSGEQDINKKHGGSNKELIKLTINCYKKFCMTAKTKQSFQIYDYYISMEEVINNYIENKILEKDNLLEETKKILELKDKQLEEKELEITTIKNHKYEEAEKIGFIYISSTDKQNIYKCGRSKCVIKRQS